MKSLLILIFMTSLLFAVDLIDNTMPEQTMYRPRIVLDGREIEQEEIEKIFIVQLQGKLTLSSSQIDSISRRYIEFKKEMIRKKAERDIARIEFEEILKSPEPDFEYMKMKSKELTKLNENMLLSRIEFMETVYGILTNKQKKILESGITQ